MASNYSLNYQQSPKIHLWETFRDSAQPGLMSGKNRSVKQQLKVAVIVAVVVLVAAVFSSSHAMPLQHSLVTHLPNVGF